MSLPTRPLGSSGLQITTVGFGAWAIGGGGWAFSWGPQDDNESIAAMRHGTGIGHQLDRHRGRVRKLGHSRKKWSENFCGICPRLSIRLVFTKCGLTWDEKIPCSKPNAFSNRKRFAGNAKNRCAAWALSAKTCTNFTGLTKCARPSKIPGLRW